MVALPLMYNRIQQDILLQKGTNEARNQKYLTHVTVKATKSKHTKKSSGWNWCYYTRVSMDRSHRYAVIGTSIPRHIQNDVKPFSNNTGHSKVTLALSSNV